jgi:hypothetical protein
MVAAAPARGHTTYSGGDLAAASTAGVASLVMAGRPDLPAGAVAARLIATADPAPGGAHSPSYGAGIVNPVRALSEPLASPAAGPIGESIPLAVRPEQPGPGPGVAVAGVFAIASLAVIGLATLRRVRRRLAREQGL